MDDRQRAQFKTSLSLLDTLIDRGRQLSEALGNDSANESVIELTRAWEEECGVAINQLSGGSKAHWLARAFSGAFLMRSANGSAVEGVAPSEIVGRLTSVLEQAVATLSQVNQDEHISLTSEAMPTPRRFDFVHNPELRPFLEQAYYEGRNALEEGSFHKAMITSCGVLEAIVTDALDHHGLNALPVSGVPDKIADWSFETRLAVAEKAGLIHGECARLPVVARRYRDHGDSALKAEVTERDARAAGQVLNVVIRDLDPGR